MTEIGGRAGRLLVVQSQEAAPAERVSAAEVDPTTADGVGTTQLTAQQGVGRRQSDRTVYFAVRQRRPRYTRYEHQPGSRFTKQISGQTYEKLRTKIFL